MNELRHALWVEKYRPQNINSYIFENPTHRGIIEKFILNKSIPHLLLSGSSGTGKTTLARILIREMDVHESDILVINASDERGIDTFREKIKSFSYLSAMSASAFKIIHLEESDALTPMAQQALKSFMEEMADYVRFILTCNNVNKIIKPIRSRCQEFIFKSSSRDEIAELIITILAKEKIKTNLKTIDKYVDAFYPDIRKIINAIQQNNLDGALTGLNTSKTEDYKLLLLDYITKDMWNEMRVLLASNVASEEYESIYRFLYDNLHYSKKFKDTNKFDLGILVIANYLKDNFIVADNEICMAACLIELKLL